MSKRKAKPEAKTSSYRKQLEPALWGIAAGLGTIIAVLTVMAVALSVGDIPQILVEPMVIAAVAMGGFSAGFISAKMVNSKGFFWAMLCGAVLFAMIMTVGLAVIHEGFGGIAFIKLFAILLFSAIGGIVGTNSRYSGR
ncbi:MAG: TIGR04086 family membrane protein [Oscillospiraceae bacterium]